MQTFITKRNALFSRSVTAFGRFVLNFFFSVDVNGIENLPTEGPYVLLPKHQKWKDIPFLTISIPCPLYYIAKYELFNNPFSGYVFSMLGGIPLNREKPMQSRDSLRKMSYLLQNRERIVIFPEGTYFLNKMGPGMPGLIRMILSKKPASFIPVGIRYLGKGIRKKVKIDIGKPVYADTKTDIENFINSIMQEIENLSQL